MIEEVVFSNITMPGEDIRLIVAFLGVVAATYYDLFNRKNVPDKLLYGFLAVAFITNLIFYSEQLFIFSLAVALFFSVIGYIFYRAGQIGGADLFVLLSIMLLLPIQPSISGLPFNMPFIISVMIFSGLLFAVYVMLDFGYKLLKSGHAKPKLLYGLLLVPYLLFAYIYVNSVLYSPVYFTILTILFIATIFFMMFKEELTLLLAEKIPVEKLEPEDVVAMEFISKETAEEYGIRRLVTEDMIKRLKDKNYGEIWVYTKLPPFLPFVLVGIVLALFFSKALLFG